MLQCVWFLGSFPAFAHVISDIEDKTLSEFLEILLPVCSYTQKLGRKLFIGLQSKQCFVAPTFQKADKIVDRAGSMEEFAMKVVELIIFELKLGLNKLFQGFDLNFLMLLHKIKCFCVCLSFSFVLMGSIGTRQNNVACRFEVDG